ncbi:MAG: FAD-dependent thymidylate synthase [Prevotella sp.]|nr:FAD-dependent thymidylate synthase [Prevotella sp.]
MKNNLPQFEIWNQEPGIDGIYRQVERAGRVCYKSEDHCTPESARPFVERMIKSDHTAMLEHATVYLLYRDGETASAEQGGDAAIEAWQRYERNKFSKVSIVDDCHYVTTNLRVLAENKWLTDLDHLTEPLAHHERRVTVHFTTQIATTREFNRHRANSMAEQSTRYCNYSKDKFGNEISINIPEWVRALSVEEPKQIDFLELAKKVTEGQADDYENWLFANSAAERAYLNLIAAGRKPQEARAILPLDTNTELIHTAFVSDWKHFFDLRAKGTTGAPHPDAKVLALPLYDEFCRLGLIEA